MDGGAIRVWSIDLDAGERRVRECMLVLDAEEIGRAERFHHAEDRQRWMVARGTLRQLLARHAAVAPGQIRFQYASHGKPELACPALRRPLWFNLSHSGGLALVAVSDVAPLGVDVEALREMRDLDRIARRFFSANEQAALAGVAPAAFTSAFYACWTRKEAYIKARGEGLSLRLDSFDVSLRPDEPARLLTIPGSAAGEANAWSLYHLEPAPGYVGALAIRATQRRPPELVEYVG